MKTTLEKKLYNRVLAGENLYDIIDQDDQFDAVEHDYRHENMTYIGDVAYADTYLVIGGEEIYQGFLKV